MSESSELVDAPPDVARVTEGLRDTGYEFNTAIADIVDNSIAANAKNVEVRLQANIEGHIFVSVIDDGEGMDRPGLINAMTYGSKRRPDPASLGKFGLGLKTASTAFSRRLVLISRPKQGEKALKAAWDLDVMAAKNAWKLEISEPSVQEAQLLDEVAKGGAGTAVLWEKVDRLLPAFKRAGGKPFKNALKRTEDVLRDHMGTVYQRFLDPEDGRARTISLKLNGAPVLPWDPFVLAETKAPVAEKEVKIELPSGESTQFYVRAFILPRKEEFSSDEARAAARVSNELQGVYVYRQQRLIHGPDWLGMYKQEPHFSLLRVELSFDYRLDDAFQVDIKKSRILLDEALYEWLRDKFLAGPRREAEQRYRKGAAAAATGAALLLHTASNNAIQQKVDVLKLATVTEMDSGSGNVALKNNAGSTTAHLRIVTNDEDANVHVATSSTLDNGVLWEATLVNGAAAVTLNTAHPYYPKAYLPNKANSVVIQSLDFLLWSLAQAELNNMSAQNKDAFEEFRIEVSRNLKKLVADLPDPPEEV